MQDEVAMVASSSKVSARPPRAPLARGDACTACKRCPANRPTCAKCLRHGRDCVYPHPATSRRESSSTTAGEAAPQNVAVSDTNMQAHTSATAGIWPLEPLGTLPTSLFLPAAGINERPDQILPIDWNDLDFSWALHELDATPSASTPAPSASMHPAEEEHLLWLYLANQSGLGMEMHITTFYRRLISANVVDRPHPALLNAMYLIACPASPIEHIRMREGEYFSRAQASMDLAVQQGDTPPSALPDLMRAATLLSIWLFGHLRYPEAVIMCSKAVRVAIICALDQVEASHILPRVKFDSIRRQRKVLNSPSSYIELGDRLYAFWSVVLVDLCASVAIGTPATFDPRTIKSPLPRPWTDYEAGREVLLSGDIYLSDLGSSTSTADPEHDTDLSRLIRAVVLLHSAVWSQPLQSDVHSPSSPSSAPRQADVRDEVLPFSARLSAAVRRFTAQLPPDFVGTIPSSHGAKTISPRAASLHFVLIAAEVYAHDNNSYEGTNDVALYHARRFVGLIRLLGSTGVGDVSRFVYVLWGMVVLILVRESKRLVRLRQHLDAAVVDADIDFVEQTLRERGSVNPMALAEAAHLAHLRQRPPSDVDETEYPQDGSTGQSTMPPTTTNSADASALS